MEKQSSEQLKRRSIIRQKSDLVVHLAPSSHTELFLQCGKLPLHQTKHTTQEIWNRVSATNPGWSVHWACLFLSGSPDSYYPVLITWSKRHSKQVTVRPSPNVPFLRFIQNVHHRKGTQACWKWEGGANCRYNLSQLFLWQLWRSLGNNKQTYFCRKLYFSQRGATWATRVGTWHGTIRYDPVLNDNDTVRYITVWQGWTYMMWSSKETITSPSVILR